MTAYSLWPAQVAVHTLLSGYAPLVALLPEGATAIYDHVPQGRVFPYIVIGDIAARPFETQTSEGHDITLTLHSYSRYRGMKEAEALMTALHDALHRIDFTIEGQTLIYCAETGAECQLDADGETRHGIQRFRLITEPA